MSTIGSPNIIQDGLVFGYMADNRTPRFYPGEPTVNLITNGNFSNGLVGWGLVGTYGTYVEVTTFKDKSCIYAKGLNNYASRGYFYQTFSNLTIGQYYTLSFKYHISAGLIFLDTDDSFNVDTSIADTGSGEWETYSVTRQAGSTTLQVYFYGVNENPGFYYLTDVQLEAKPHATPFVNGTRLAIQGLLDLTRTHSIDLTNMSFDVNGEPYFNGSDNSIAAPSSISQLIKGGGTPFTFDFWAFSNENSYRDIYFGDFATEGAVNFNMEKLGDAFRFYWNGSPDHGVSGILNYGVWINLVVVYDGTTLKLYKDGVLSHTLNGTLPTINKTSGNFLIGRDGRTGETCLNGKLPELRIYNRPLSLTEIQQNFNAHRGLYGV